MAGINLVPQLKGQVEVLEDDALPAEEQTLLEKFKSGDLLTDERLDALDYIKLGGLVLIVAAFFWAQEISRQTTTSLIAEEQKKIQKVKNDMGQAETKLNSLKAFLAESERYEKEKITLQNKLDSFKETTHNREFIVKIVDFLVLNMPDTVWLDQINADLLTEKKISVSGLTTSLQDLAKFLKTLEGAVFYPSWVLAQTQEVNSSEVKGDKDKRLVEGAKKFEMSAKVLGTP